MIDMYIERTLRVSKKDKHAAVCTSIYDTNCRKVNIHYVNWLENSSTSDIQHKHNIHISIRYFHKHTYAQSTQTEVKNERKQPHTARIPTNKTAINNNTNYKAEPHANKRTATHTHTKKRTPKQSQE